MICRRIPRYESAKEVTEKLSTFLNYSQLLSFAEKIIFRGLLSGNHNSRNPVFLCLCRDSCHLEETLQSTINLDCKEQFIFMTYNPTSELWGEARKIHELIQVLTVTTNKGLVKV